MDRWVWTTSEVADKCRISKRTIYNFQRQGLVRAGHKKGFRTHFFTSGDVNKLIKAVYGLDYEPESPGSGLEKLNQKIDEVLEWVRKQ